MLQRAGVGAGDAVLVFVPMSIELYVAMIAIFRVGGVAMFLDPSAGRAHISRCCEMSPPVALIAVSRAHLLRLSTPALRQIPRKYSVGLPVPGAKRWERFKHHDPLREIAARAEDDAALVTFTSGSTGKPKGAVRTHRFLAAQHAALQPAIALAPGQVDLATLPIFSLANLASGVTSIIPDADLRKPGHVRTAPILRQLEAHRVTRAVASPAFLERLLRDPFAPAAMRTMERIYTGGAPVFPALMERLQCALPHAEVIALYGSTEAEPIAHVAWSEITKDDLAAMLGGRGLLAGMPVSEVELAILDAEWGAPLGAMTLEEFVRRRCAQGEPGEIVVAGMHVLRGYLHGEGDAETKFRVADQVWHRTGDAGYLDERGRLWLLGRAQARLTDEHGTIYPFSVECAASQVPGVRRSALIQHRGRRLLVVEAEPDAPANLRDAVAAKLTAAKLHDVRLLPSIPVDKRHNAKIDYVELARRIR